MFKTRLVFVVLIVVLVLLASPVLPLTIAQENSPPAVGLRPDAPPYAVHGPYWVGTREFVVEPNSERPLPVTVWYPAVSDAPEAMYTYMWDPLSLPFTGQAIPETTPDLDHGPYPLVLFSHGAGGTRYGALYLTEHLASYGFVVIALDHTGDTIVNSEDEGVFVRSHVTCPIDITRVIDFAESAAAAGGALENLIDTDQVAVAGHSSGAWTAFLAAGGQRDFRALTAWCADNPDDYWVCETLLGQEETSLPSWVSTLFQKACGPQWVTRAWTPSFRWPREMPQHLGQRGWRRSRFPHSS